MKRQNRNYRKLYRYGKIKNRCEAADGGYYPLQKIEAALDSSGTAALLRRRDGRLLPFLEALFGEYGDTLTPALLRQAILRESRKKKAVFSDAELFALPDLLALCCLRLLSEAPDERWESALSAAARLLRSTEEGEPLDTKALYPALSPVDAALRRGNPLAYQESDEATRHGIRQEVYRLAKQKRISEADAALLYCRGSRPRHFPGWGYFALWGGLFALLQAGAFLLLGRPAFFLLLPFSELSKGIADGILSRFLPARQIPKLEPGPIPAEGATLVVVTTLLTEKCGALFHKLEILWRQTREENVRFGLLLDLRESESYTLPEDEALLREALAGLDELRARCGDRFDLFLRSRVKQPGTGRFCGWERKRGALLELCRLADGEESSLRQYGDGAFLKNCRYILTLDADTELRIGAVRELVAAMRHPANRPVVRDGAVREGHALLQPAVVTSLAAACASPFAVMLSGSGGTDLYQSSAKDLMQTLFGRGIYCGKGIFDKKVYREVLEGAFPENRILSHDLIEGTRLRAGALPCLSLSDGCPSTAAGWFRRQHRWLRGDFQSLPFAFSRVKNASGEKIRNPIGAVERFWLFDNIRRALLPAAACALLLRSLFLPKKASAALLLLGLFYLFLPVLRAVLRCRGKLLRRFYSNVLEGGWHALCEALFGTVTLFHQAILSLDALCRAFWRTAVSHKNCLEWVTAAESDGGDGATALYRRFFPSVAAGLLLAILAPYPLQKLVGVGFFFCPLFAWLLSQPYPAERDPGAKKKALLTDWSRDAFGFYEMTVGKEDHFLPPDNLQLLPVETVAHRTSPTNIAMYLLSLLAAADFAFLTPEEMAVRLERTLDTLEKLPKHRGLLYNWYDTRTLEVLGAPYLSSVDCGNYLCALVTLRQGLREYEESCPALRKIGERFGALESASDLRLLYNEKKELFCIGYDPLKGEQSECCYDLLMSESRLTGYYAVARGLVPPRHWAKLGRPLIGREGHIGLGSWSGTAFEYFLPALLLRSFPGSLSYEALGFSLCEQMADPAPGGEYWGRSESGYFAFDADMNYQYRAFGCRRLALSPEEEPQQVFAPYGLFLALAVSFAQPLRALQKLKSRGMYGKYGFFEALDETPSRVGEGRAVIRSYMAHHTGMILCACCNACFGNRMQQRFLRDGDMAAATELLCERIPVDAPVRSDSRRPLPRESRPAVIRLPVTLLRQEEENAAPPETALLAGGLRLLADADGRIALFSGEECLTYPRLSGEAAGLRTLRLFFSDGKRCFDLLRGDTDGTDIRVENRGGALRFIRDLPKEKLHTEVEFAPAGEMPFLAIRLTAEGAFTKAIPLLILEPILFPLRDYDAHPDYRRLQLAAEYREADRLLLYRRLPESERRKPLAMLLTSIGGGQQACATRLDGLLPRSYREEDLRALCGGELSPSPTEGGLGTPFCALRKQASCRSGRYREVFLLGAGEDAEALAAAALRLRRQGTRLFGDFALSMEETARRQIRTAGILPHQRKFESLLLTRLLHDPPLREGAAPIGALWQTGISGDLPIVCLSCESETPTAAGRTLLAGLLRAHRLLRLKGFPFDFVLFYGKGEAYADAGRRAMENLARAHSAPGVIGRAGGVHLLPEAFLPAVRPYAALSGSLGEDTLPDTLFPAKEAALPAKIEARPRPIPGEKAPREGFLVRAGAGLAPAGRPYSMLYANPAFGTLLTHRSLGWSWFANAKLFPLTKRPDCALPEAAGERLLLTVGEKCYDLAACAGETLFSEGESCWSGETPEGISYRLTAGVAGKFPLKIVTLRLRNETKGPLSVGVRYALRPDLGSPGYALRRDGQTRFFRGCRENGCWGMFLYASGEGLLLSPGGSGELRFLLGPIRFPHDRAYYALRERFEKRGDPTALPRPAVFTLRSGDPGLDGLFNRDLPRQLLRSRLWGRCGPDQCSGAWGFRDQLQDCLNFAEWQPELLKIQLFRCAARQYYPGDVQHWWHKDLAASLPPDSEESIRARTGAGLRSRCGDDLLWLPYAIARYFALTGDKAAIETKIAYLESPALSPEESERYESALPTGRKESLYTHGMRAIEAALSRLGESGLPLFGGGDWNDGMGAVGIGGKGESVWLGQFLLLVLREYAPMAGLFGTGEDRRRISEGTASLGAALPGWYRDDRYARGSFDNGQVFGIKGCGECELDLLPQAFAAILGLPHADTCMDTALRELWRGNEGMWLLLAPPFTGEALPFAGHIEGYAPGLRENAGQYTHGALFGVWGLLALGRTEEAWRIFKRLLPTAQAKRPGYGGEPYAIAADISNAPGMRGQVGWTHYTGAAGWALHLLLCGFLGYGETPEGFTLAPSAAVGEFSLTIEKRGTVYEITVRPGEAVLDGKTVSPDCRFPFDGGRHRLALAPR